MADRRIDLSKLPFENEIGNAIDQLHSQINDTAPMKKARELHAKIPQVPKVEVPTPFGEVTLPQMNPIPEPNLPALDDRKREALKNSVMMDLSAVISAIPVVGDIIGEEVSDLYTAQLRKNLTPAEYDKFLKYDKFNPLDTIACLRVFMSKK